MKIKDLLDLQGELGNLVSLWVLSLCWKKTCILERVIHHTCTETWNCTALHSPQLHFYQMGFNPTAEEDPACTAHMSGAGVWAVTASRKQRQAAAVLTYRCSQSSNSTCSLGSAAALSGLDVEKGAELTGLLQWFLHIKDVSFQILVNNQHKMHEIKERCKTSHCATVFDIDLVCHFVTAWHITF